MRKNLVRNLAKIFEDSIKLSTGSLKVPKDHAKDNAEYRIFLNKLPFLCDIWNKHPLPLRLIEAQEFSREQVQTQVPQKSAP